MSQRLLAALREIRTADAEDVASLARHLESIVYRFATADVDASAVEIINGEVSLRLAHARAKDEAARANRQIALLRALSRAAAEALRMPETAERAAREIRAVFPGANIVVHIVVDGHLDMLTRQGDSGTLENAPEWLRRVPLDGPTELAKAVREKRTITTPVRDRQQPWRSSVQAHGVRHLHIVPLKFDGAVFGTITVAHRQELPWDPESLRLLDSAAIQLGVDFAHVQLLEAERRRADDLRLVNELGSLVAQQLELPAVLSTAVNQVARLMDVPRVHVFLANADKTALVGVACSQELSADAVVPLTSISPAARAFCTREPVTASHLGAELLAEPSYAAHLGMRSILAVPLISRGEAIGVIALAELRHQRTFTSTEAARVLAVANLLAPAVASAKMFDDLRRSYEALARTQAELVTHERLAALGELSAVIAHEVRNPLAIIFNSLGALRRQGTQTPDAAVLLDIVGEEAARLNRIVSDLLDFVRPYTSHPRTVRIDAIVRGAVEAAERAAPNTNVAVVTEVNLVSDEVLLDGTMLQQALINLIVNAMQASPKGRTVIVLVAVRSEADAPRLCCDVTDEGAGIDAADTARIFQPFFTTKATGTGLGLAVVRRIADALGGVIEVTRAPAGGTRFSLSVPLAPTAALEASVPPLSV